MDRERCIGAGMCVLTAPDVFDQDDEDGKVLLRAPALRRRTAGTAVRQAAHLCPIGAIALPGDGP
ncbi:ferredoxin [Streptomyces sp. A30]|uniref:ferredoxin n=1 Tax=Streptomyces sp. A30 TaxID=2789273 RepID=UPI00397EDB74